MKGATSILALLVVVGLYSPWFVNMEYRASFLGAPSQLIIALIGTLIIFFALIVVASKSKGQKQ